MQSLLRFSGGFLVGAGILLGFALAAVAATWVFFGFVERSDAPHLAVSGAAMTARGAAMVEIQGGDARVRWICRDGCDDVEAASMATSLKAVRAHDVDGECVVCRDYALFRESTAAEGVLLAGAPRLTSRWQR
ncbi:hypothetical protein [Phenylobacterium sp.]|uniref:hypothetical protein n=1 Tax=Phenylobacterium sp. TaxID=1871053 RepID=UPI00281183FC|nr:hypothetical protein [Phenylobacterium sp.]